MDLLRKILLAVGLISFLTFVALFGQLPALRRTPIGSLQRLLCIHVPSAFRQIDRFITGGQVTTRGQRLGRYLFFQKNPVVLILFLSLLTVSAALFLYWSLQRLPTYLKLPIPLLLAMPYVFTYLCVVSRPHIVPANHAARVQDYPYDHIIFRPNNVCSTCNLVKPARSKHCSLCGYCVAKCDHHCPWVNNCLGRGNYRWFLALLSSLGALQIYGAYLSWHLLQPAMHVRPGIALFSWEHFEDMGNALVIAVNVGGLSIAGVGFLAASTSCLPLGLLAYHLYLVWAGMTTNESQKWAEWKEDMLDGYVFRARRDDLRRHNRSKNIDGPRTIAIQNPALDVFKDDDGEVSWPVSSEWVLVRTKDGRPPQGQQAIWNQVWSLTEVDNVYDLGTLQNIMEVVKGR